MATVVRDNLRWIVDVSTQNVSFIGPNAQLTPSQRAAYSLAQKMAREGRSREEIWAKTGKLGMPWFKDAQNRFWGEIDDTPMKLKSFPSATPKKFGDIVDHPELFQAYPSKRNNPVITLDEGPSIGGSYNPTGVGGGQVRINPDAVSAAQAPPTPPPPIESRGNQPRARPERSHQGGRTYPVDQTPSLAHSDIPHHSGEYTPLPPLNDSWHKPSDERIRIYLNHEINHDTQDIERAVLNEYITSITDARFKMNMEERKKKPPWESEGDAKARYPGLTRNWFPTFK